MFSTFILRLSNTLRLWKIWSFIWACVIFLNTTISILDRYSTSLHRNPKILIFSKAPPLLNIFVQCFLLKMIVLNKIFCKKLFASHKTVDAFTGCSQTIWTILNTWSCPHAYKVKWELNAQARLWHYRNEATIAVVRH